MPTRVALVVGIGYYKYHDSLEFCPPSAKEVFELFISPQYGMCDPERSRLITIVGEGETFTTANLFGEICEVIGSLQVGDQFLFFFSGHAELYQDTLFLTTTNSEKPQQGYRFSHLIDELRSNNIDKAIIIIDACHSEAMFDSIKNLQSGEWHPHKLPKGFGFMAASGKFGYARQEPEVGHTLFSHYFCEGVKNGIKDEGQYITLPALKKYINSKIKEAFKGYSQQVHTWICEGEAELWLSKNPTPTTMPTVEPLRSGLNTLPLTPKRIAAIVLFLMLILSVIVFAVYSQFYQPYIDGRATVQAAMATKEANETLVSKLVASFTATVVQTITPTPTATNTSTATSIPAFTNTPDVVATEFAIRRAVDATNTALAPTPTHTPSPTNTPTFTPTNTPPPPPPTATFTPTPAPTPTPSGIFSFSSLVNGRCQTYIFNLANSATTPLYIHDGVADADIQPGAQRLAYRWADSGRGGIYRMDFDGSNQQQLTGYVEDQSPNWSADGTKVFLSSTRGGDRISHIYRINGDGTGGELGFLTAYGRDPVEPRSGLILFAGHLSYGSGACGIIYYQWGQKAGSGEITPGTEGRISDQCFDYRPDVSGNQVVFMRQVDGQPYDIWQNQIGVDVQSLAENMTDTPDTNEVLPVFSPDGQWIAFASDRGGGWNIYVMKSDGSSEPATLVNVPSGTDFSDWSLSRLSWAN